MRLRHLLTGASVLAMCVRAWAAEVPLRVVTTLPDYAVIAKAIGGSRISVQAIVKGEQDAHFIRPKPSFVNMVREADVLIDTGLDLEMWVPAVVDKAGNNRVRSGQDGYVATAKGMRMLEKPRVMSRSEGGLHVYGNPHLTTSPVNMRVAAGNIATGLIRNDPDGKAYYESGLTNFVGKLDEKLFGDGLVRILGGDTLCQLAVEGRLIEFLEQHEYEGEPLAARLGGWMKQMLPLRGTPVVTYHKNWVYFIQLFGLEEAGTVEPKPGIPPSPKHVLDLTRMMRQRQVKIILAANYFDHEKVRTVADRVGAEPVIVPLYVGGREGVDDYFSLVGLWIDSLLTAARKQGLLK